MSAECASVVRSEVSSRVRDVAAFGWRTSARVSVCWWTEAPVVPSPISLYDALLAGLQGEAARRFWRSASLKPDAGELGVNRASSASS